MKTIEKYRPIKGDLGVARRFGNSFQREFQSRRNTIPELQPHYSDEQTEINTWIERNGTRRNYF